MSEFDLERLRQPLDVERPKDRLDDLGLTSLKRGAKESACGCAGCYTAYGAIELYAEIFEDLGVLDKLEAFASFNGPDFYGMPRNTDEITLVKESWRVPSEMPFGNDVIVPLRAGETLRWKLEY